MRKEDERPLLQAGEIFPPPPPLSCFLLAWAARQATETRRGMPCRPRATSLHRMRVHVSSKGAFALAENKTYPLEIPLARYIFYYPILGNQHCDIQRAGLPETAGGRKGDIGGASRERGEEGGERNKAMLISG